MKVTGWWGIHGQTELGTKNAWSALEQEKKLHNPSFVSTSDGFRGSVLENGVVFLL